MAGVLALFAAAPVRLLDPLPRRRRDRDPPILSATVRGLFFDRVASTRRAPDRRITPTHPAPSLRHPLPPFESPRLASDVAGQRRDQARPRQGGRGSQNAFTKGTGKAPRAFLKDEKAEVLTAYGLTSLPDSNPKIFIPDDERR